MATLAEIRAKLKEAESRTGGSNQSSGGDNAIYPFWNLKEGEQSTVRFLPDGDQSADFFWKERLMIKLPFAGVKGETAVLTACEKKYGDESLAPAAIIMKKLVTNQDGEMERIKHLAGLDN